MALPTLKFSKRYFLTSDTDRRQTEEHRKDSTTKFDPLENPDDRRVRQAYQKIKDNRGIS